MAEVNTIWEVSAEDVKGMLDRGEPLVLIDVRQPEEYAIARIHGARFIPLGDLPMHLRQLESCGDEPIVTYCHKGARSLQAAAFLRQQGFTNARSMAGGIEAWSLRIDGNVPRY
jgi:adenylyltransferase/sulfurtransferase